jgi:hypothetical protein
MNDASPSVDPASLAGPPRSEHRFWAVWAILVGSLIVAGVGTRLVVRPGALPLLWRLQGRRAHRPDQRGATAVHARRSRNQREKPKSQIRNKFKTRSSKSKTSRGESRSLRTEFDLPQGSQGSRAAFCATGDP